MTPWQKRIADWRDDPVRFVREQFKVEPELLAGGRAHSLSLRAAPVHEGGEGTWQVGRSRLDRLAFPAVLSTFNDRRHVDLGRQPQVGLMDRVGALADAKPAAHGIV